MTIDHATIQIALNEAAFILADHFNPGLPRNPLATVKRLLEVLDSQEVARPAGGWTGAMG
jgi:hypothetical protein